MGFMGDMGLLGGILDVPIYWAGTLLIWGLFFFILIQILIQFEIIPRHNQPARLAWARLSRIYDPMLRPLRRMLPNLAGFDLSPLVLVFGLYLVRSLLLWVF